MQNSVYVSVQCGNRNDTRFDIDLLAADGVKSSVKIQGKKDTWTYGRPVLE